VINQICRKCSDNCKGHSCCILFTFVWRHCPRILLFQNCSWKVFI